MIIGLLTIEIYMPYSHSLKEKRKTLNSLKDRLKKRYNVAITEVDYHNKWQRSRLGLVTINNQKVMIEKIFHKIINETEQEVEGEILFKEIDYF
jgi:hypothetical protein